MEECQVTFHAHGIESPEVKERLAVYKANAERNMDAINKRLAPNMPRFNARARAIQDSPRSAVSRIESLWGLADEMMAFNGPNAACKRGCAHCCHIAVAVTEPEARLIGKRIGRTPREVEHRNSFRDFDYGYHNPCSFLRNGQCSIYEHRPLTCRVHVSLDVDALLCELTPPDTCEVPYLNPNVFNALLADIVTQSGNVAVTVADIRDWFPKREK